MAGTAAGPEKDDEMTLRLPAAALAILPALAAPALALTADEVWQNQTGYLGALGVSVAATPRRDGATTTMTDVRFVWTGPAGLGEVTLDAPDVTLTEEPDGSVTIGYPAAFTMPLSASLTLDGETAGVQTAIAVRLDGHSTVASGTPDSVSYVSQAAFLDIVLDGLTIEGSPAIAITDFPLNLIVTTWESSGTATISRDSGLHRIGATSTQGQVIFEAGWQDTFGLRTTIAGATEAGSSEYRMTIPETPVDWRDPSAALREGLSFEGTVSSVGTRQQTVVMADDAVLSSDGQTTDRSTQSLAISAAGLAVSGTAQGITYSRPADEMVPVAVTVSLEDAAGSLALPLLADSAPQEVSFAIDLRGITANDEVWSLVDPSAVLPRDPAVLALSVGAEVVNRVDLLNVGGWEEVADRMASGDVPVDLLSLTVTGLEAAAVGVRLTGEARFTFDNADRTTFPGMPRPEGEASARISGLYGLLERLSQSGLVPKEAILGARASIESFAQPSGEDEVTSQLRIGPDGAVTLNGMAFPLQ
jgi:hypothetical protein